jgi:hypothetical protein
MILKAVVKTFKTPSLKLMALSNWLSAEGATHRAMEATGVYWGPVSFWNLPDATEVVP